MKRMLSLMMITALILALSLRVHAQQTPSTAARAAVLYCVNSGEMLYAEHPDLRLPMASTTKIMTALLTLEEAERQNRTVTFTEGMQAEGSSMYLDVGEQVALDDLAVGMMMQSGNDAANAAALTIAGSYGTFSDLMNRRAAQLGMKNTHFVTPSGLDDEQHYSTAFDMALLMAAAMENERFAEITAQTSMTVDFIRPADKSVTYPNHNRLLTLYDGCIGGKTGYTDRAGRCLVTCAERDGLRLVAVTLSDRDDWNDHIALYDSAFARYAAVDVPDLPDQCDIAGGIGDKLNISLSDQQGLVVDKDVLSEITCSVYLPPFLYAPVQKGDEVGAVEYFRGDECIRRIPILSEENVIYDSRRRGFLQYIKDLLNWQNQ